MFVEIHEGRRGAGGVWLAAVAYVVREHFRAFLRGHAYNPMQPRDEIGRWTVTGVQVPVPGLAPSVSGEADGVQIAQGTGLPGYGVDLAQEEGGPNGGHTIERHVGKSDAYLRKRAELAQFQAFGMTIGTPRFGSFSSLEAANKLVNSTLSQNANKVADLVEGKFPFWPSRIFLTADFDSPTGREAYTRSGRGAVQLRDTYSVGVVLVRDGSTARGYRVMVAYPRNED